MDKHRYGYICMFLAFFVPWHQAGDSIQEENHVLLNELESIVVEFKSTLAKRNTTEETEETRKHLDSLERKWKELMKKTKKPIFENYTNSLGLTSSDRPLRVKSNCFSNTLNLSNSNPSSALGTYPRREEESPCKYKDVDIGNIKKSKQVQAEKKAIKKKKTRSLSKGWMEKKQSFMSLFSKEKKKKAEDMEPEEDCISEFIYCSEIANKPRQDERRQSSVFGLKLESEPEPESQLDANHSSKPLTPNMQLHKRRDSVPNFSTLSSTDSIQSPARPLRKRNSMVYSTASTDASLQLRFPDAPRKPPRTRIIPTDNTEVGFHHSIFGSMRYTALKIAQREKEKAAMLCKEQEMELISTEEEGANSRVSVEVDHYQIENVQEAPSKDPEECSVQTEETSQKTSEESKDQTEQKKPIPFVRKSQSKKMKVRFAPLELEEHFLDENIPCMREIEEPVQDQEKEKVEFVPFELEECEYFPDENIPCMREIEEPVQDQEKEKVEFVPFELEEYKYFPDENVPCKREIEESGQDQEKEKEGEREDTDSLTQNEPMRPKKKLDKEGRGAGNNIVFVPNDVVKDAYELEKKLIKPILKKDIMDKMMKKTTMALEKRLANPAEDVESMKPIMQVLNREIIVDVIKEVEEELITELEKERMIALVKKEEDSTWIETLTKLIKELIKESKEELLVKMKDKEDVEEVAVEDDSEEEVSEENNKEEKDKEEKDKEGDDKEGDDKEEDDKEEKDKEELKAFINIADFQIPNMELLASE
ncbi:hypothetical protein NECID01_1165 [Nematocida sp. AWRm77]|nr:hypothetical protein NECID01_1165 [Nematocida sp. AWRm77]